MLHRTDLLTIGELSARSGFAPSALRYYEPRPDHLEPHIWGTSAAISGRCCAAWHSSDQGQLAGLSLEEITEALRTLPEVAC